MEIMVWTKQGKQLTYLPGPTDAVTIYRDKTQEIYMCIFSLAVGARDTAPFWFHWPPFRSRGWGGELFRFHFWHDGEMLHSQGIGALNSKGTLLHWSIDIILVQLVMGVIPVGGFLDGDVAKGNAITRKESFRDSFKKNIMPKCK